MGAAPGHGGTKLDELTSGTLTRPSGAISPIFSIFCLFVSLTIRIPRPFFSRGSSSVFWICLEPVEDMSMGPIGCGGAGTNGRFLVRISFRIRILMPWSAIAHESCVDSRDGLAQIHFSKLNAYLPCQGISWLYKRRMVRNIWTCNGVRRVYKVRSVSLRS